MAAPADENRFLQEDEATLAPQLLDYCPYPFLEKDGVVIMETETIFDAKQHWPWVLEANATEPNLSQFHGTGYIRMNANNMWGGGPKGYMDFYVQITNPGTYQFYLRTWKDHPDSTLYVFAFPSRQFAGFHF